MVDRHSVIDLYLHISAHVQQLDPILAGFCELRNTVLLRVDLAPNCLASVGIGESSLLDELQLRADPNCTDWHMRAGYDVAHLHV